MIALDTNILVRHLTEDDKPQLKLVHSLFKKNNEEGDLFVSSIVIIELNWVLQSCYEWSEGQFCDALEDILKCPQFNLENSTAIRMSLTRCRKGQEFTDSLIGQIGISKNAKTHTFDKKLKKDSAFVLLLDE